jgi:predicted DNA-binding transcriptional regulator AlpA
MPARTRRESTQEQPAVDRVAYSVIEFAQAHGVSRAHLYNLWKDGLGPKAMRVGRRTLISKEAAETWRRKMETDAEPA